jgi:putative Mg2+ transporter-C (MgtC) family protein
MGEAREIGEILLRMAAAYALALPIGWQRERSSRGLGLRTFPLVALASCAYALLALEIADGDPNATSRVLAGLMTGIGFIGGGAILKRTAASEIHGTSTAAGVWGTGAIGAAAALGRWELAVAVSLATFGTFRLLGPLKEHLDDAHDRGGVH